MNTLQMQTCPLKRARRGFTLVEVLATLVLLGIVLPPIMRCTSIALSAASSARHTTEAAALAQTQLQQVIALNQWSQSMQGDFSQQGHPEYQWTIQSQPRDYGVSDVMITVSWKEAGADRQLRLTTLAYDTTTTTGGM
jgi:prepilin-type N-terminal cleavage/methylation domain-containing protein